MRAAARLHLVGCDEGDACCKVGFEHGIHVAVDERERGPANGLDPSGIQDMRRLLARLRDRGVTVFISSHILSELEQIADWILVLKEGRLLFHGTMADLLVRRRTTWMLVPERPELLDPLVGLLTRAGYDASRQNGHVRLEGLQGRAAAVNRLAMEGGIVLDEISQVRSNLEETFMAITDGGER